MSLVTQKRCDGCTAIIDPKLEDALIFDGTLTRLSLVKGRGGGETLGRGHWDFCSIACLVKRFNTERELNSERKP